MVVIDKHVMNLAFQNDGKHNIFRKPGKRQDTQIHVNVLVRDYVNRKNDKDAYLENHK